MGSNLSSLGGLPATYYQAMPDRLICQGIDPHSDLCKLHSQKPDMWGQTATHGEWD